MLTLSLRDCWLGPKYSGKVETVAGRKIRPLVFELDSLMLSERELNALLGEPYAWSRLYKPNDAGDGMVPFLRGVKSLELEKPIEVANVRVRYGERFDSELHFVDCVLTKIKLSLIEGGNTAFACKVKTKPTLDDTLAELFEFFDEKIRAELVLLPPNVQAELPLNTIGTPAEQQEVSHTSAQPPVKRKPRKRSNNQATVQ